MILTLLASEFFVAKEQPLTVEPRTPQQNFPEHTHNFDEIVIVSQGNGRHIINGYPQTLRQGMILYIDAKDHHLYENVDNLYLTNILFQSYDFQYIANISQVINAIKTNNNGSQCINRKALHTLKNLLERLEKETDNSLQKECLLLRILSFLQKHQYAIEGFGNTERKIQQLLQWLKHNFTEEINWESLAQQFDLPLRSLHRYIKNNTGCSPQHYVTKLKLAEAYYQLRYTDKNITDIAYQCGFNDSGYFATCFKNEFMINPKALRAM
ncbi:HTH-type transcriptional activator RhaS [Necropsobacter rosorum]|uniref:HTH-type transcriptional activator RhaS n=1 Tax=Necropsobacter rosorum TaxID=908285 RepID=UPI003C7E2835